MSVKKTKQSKTLTEKKSCADRLLRNINDEDWNSFNQLKLAHNTQFPNNKISNKKFFQLLNTYSPMVRSLMNLDPKDSDIQQLGVNTALTSTPMWCTNIGNNMARIKKEHDIKELYGKYKGKSAIVIGAGPSLYNNASGCKNHLELIKEYAENFDGVIILADRILGDCIKLGIGDYVSVVDGSVKIHDLFFTTEEFRKSNLYSGVGGYEPDLKYHSDMKAFMAVSAHEKTVNAWAGDIYFLTPSIPQEILPNASSIMSDITGKTDLNCGGNCGMLAWNMATYMGCKEVAMVGMDFSYKIDTPLEEHQSYKLYADCFGKDKAHEGYTTNVHPFFKTPYRIDNIYAAFRDVAVVWIEAFKERGTCTTYNCSEGGALHSDKMDYAYLKDFLESHQKKE